MTRVELFNDNEKTHQDDVIKIGNGFTPGETPAGEGLDT